MAKFISENFSFIKKFPIFAIISVVLVATAVVALVLAPFGTNLFNLDIDFTGGTAMTFEMHKVMDRAELDNVARIITEVTGQAPSAPQQLGGPQGTQVFVRTQDLDTNQREAVFEALQEAYGLQDGDRISIRNVGASVGRDMQQAAVLSTIIAVIGILLYITIRFNFFSGFAAVVALLHDLLVTISVYVIFQIPLNLNFVAVMLTVLGYSINATIVTFDRVRENRTIMTKTKNNVIFDRSIRQTFTRTLNTTLTTLLPILMLIGLGVPSVRNFVIPLAVGILAGAYSSVCISPPLWYTITKKKEA